jgi:hypothetical protein
MRLPGPSSRIRFFLWMYWFSNYKRTWCVETPGLRTGLPRENFVLSRLVIDKHRFEHCTRPVLLRRLTEHECYSSDIHFIAIWSTCSLERMNVTTFQGLCVNWIIKLITQQCLHFVHSKQITFLPLNCIFISELSHSHERRYQVITT